LLLTWSTAQNEYLVYSAMHMARLYTVTSLNDFISGNNGP